MGEIKKLFTVKQQERARFYFINLSNQFKMKQKTFQLCILICSVTVVPQRLFAFSEN